jgi:hypothetical protein
MNRKDFLRLAGLAPMSFLMDTPSFLIDLAQPPDVLFLRKGTEAYEQLRKGFNKRIDKYPEIIAKCFTEKGVIEAVKKAKKESLPVAIKSGGHCMEGFSINQDGMAINLSELKKIEWLDERTVQVGPACTLSELYDALLPKGVIIPGGSCAGVAIGGLALGGGYGLLSRSLGLTCDSLIGLRMVNGKGECIDTNADPILLKACKGGNSGNFGVVTSLRFRVHDAPKYMQSFKFRSYAVTTQRAFNLFENWFKQSAALPNHCFSAFVLNRKTAYILLVNTGKQTEAVNAFIQLCKSISDKSTQSIKQPLAQALKNYYGRREPLYFKNASAGLYQGFDDIKDRLQSVIEKVGKSNGMIFQINTLGGKVKDEGYAKSSVFPHRNLMFFSELQVYWDKPSQQESGLKAFQEVQMLINPKGDMPQYRNYPDLRFKNAPEVYYGENYGLLQTLKKKYDSENLFRYEQSIKA